MNSLAKVRLHSQAQSNIPATGQRRDILLKCLRKIQVSPERGGDFQWLPPQLERATEVSVVVGYAITWLYSPDTQVITVLDIRPQ